MKILLILSKRLQAHLFQSVRLLILLTCMCLAQPFAALAQTNTPVPLPPAAQEALNNGILAAKLPDYLLAIRYFEEARKIDPHSPVVYLNMGLAESKIPGRELRAIAWFGAYLAANPGAPNSAAVKEQIAVLKVRNQSNTSRFLKTLEDAAKQIKESRVWLEDQWFIPDARRDNLLKVAALWQASGDFPSALKTANSFPSNFYKSQVQTDIGFAQIKAGDLKGAQRTFTAAMRTAGHLPSGSVSSNRIMHIAVGHARTGDIVGALQSADSLQDDDLKSQAQFNIALEQVRAGDAEGSLKTFMIADQTAERIQKPDVKSKTKLFFAKNRSHDSKPASAIPPLYPVITVSDWIKKLDDDNKNTDCPLNSEPFLDLTGYLKSLSSNDAEKIFNGMFSAAEKIVSAQNVIHQMLKQQEGK